VGVLGGPLSDYLSETDWTKLQSLLETDFSPSPAAEVLGRAHAFADAGDGKYALIEGVMALELALSEFAARHIQLTGDLSNKLAAFWDLHLPAKVIAAATFSRAVSYEDLTATLKAIEHRNEVVHEGKSFNTSVNAQFPGLLRTAAAFIDGPSFRFPRKYTGNRLSPPPGG
jgi:hypothetical protein